VSITDLPTPSRAARSGRPSLEEAAALPQRILASARTVFLEHGYAATTLQQIAEHAGATKRTLYVKFGDKEALFSACVVDMLKDWRGTAAHIAPGGSLQHRLESLGQHLLSAILAPDMVRLQRITLAEAHRFPWLVELLARQIEEGPLPQIGRILMEARNDTALSVDDRVSARLLNDMITGPPLRVALIGLQPSVPIGHAEWVRRVVGLFLQGWTITRGGIEAEAK
jgi:AcrR family transcriptional regulator